MRIKIKNLGTLDDAEFKLGDLTIICGENNTGKTYATYALHGFLAGWRRLISTRPTIKDESCITSLMRSGTGNVDVEIYKEKIDNILKNVCKSYSKTLPQFFASSEDKFADSRFSISIDKKDISLPSRFEHRFRLGESVRLSVSKSEADAVPHVSLVQIDDESEILQDRIERIVRRTVIRLLLDSVFPPVFIASTERTGAAIFRKELDFAHSRLLEEMSIEKKKDPVELLRDAYENYPLPVADNLAGVYCEGVQAST